MQTQVFVVGKGRCLVLSLRAEAEPSVFLGADEASCRPRAAVAMTRLGSIDVVPSLLCSCLAHVAPTFLALFESYHAIKKKYI